MASASSNSSDAVNIWRVGTDQPVFILDRPARLTPIFALTGAKAGKSMVVSCVSADQISVYSFRVKKHSKQSVRTADTVISLQSKAMNQIFAATIVGEDQVEALQVVHGSLFGLVKQQKTIIDAATSKFIAKIAISDINPEEVKARSK